MLTAGFTMLVASSLPPMPVSMMAQSTSLGRKFVQGHGCGELEKGGFTLAAVHAFYLAIGFHHAFVGYLFGC